MIVTHITPTTDRTTWQGYFVDNLKSAVEVAEHLNTKLTVEYLSWGSGKPVITFDGLDPFVEGSHHWIVAEYSDGELQDWSLVHQFEYDAGWETLSSWEG